MITAPVNSGPAGPSNGTDGVAATDREIDAGLLARAVQGDANAFRTLVGRHQKRAHAVAYGLVHNAEDARDVVQDAFVRVFKHQHEFAGQASFSTWLYRIVVNLSIDLIRKRRGARFVDTDDSPGTIETQADPSVVFRLDADPRDALDRKRIASAMETALEALPPYHRAVILLREVEGLSYEEMAEAMQVSKGTIMSRLFHARRKMQTMLRASLGDDAVPGLNESERDDDATS